MPTAIIYCAENILSGKKYVGRTIRSLDIRKEEHFRKTVKQNHKFAKALRCYSSEFWEWYVLKEVEYNQVDFYEKYFIADLDTCNPLKGYNTLADNSFEGEANPSYNPEIVSLYHPSYGTVSGTRADLASLYPDLADVRWLLSKRNKCLKGWILAENKDEYIKVTTKRNCKPRKIVTLAHETHGTFTMFQKEFVDTFGLKHNEIAHLASGRRKSAKGWILVKEEE